MSSEFYLSHSKSISRCKWAKTESFSDSNRFTSTYAADFKKICEGTFHEFSEEKQPEKLRDFLFKKFSVDPRKQSMTPKPGMPCKTLSWIGFYITDDELDQIFFRVISIIYRNGAYRHL